MPFELSSAGLVKAVDQVSKNKLSYKHSENIFERIARVSLFIILFPPGSKIKFYLQSVNRWAESVANMFATNPLRMVALIVVVVGVLAWFVAKILGDDIGDSHRGRSRDKSRRLD